MASDAAVSTSVRSRTSEDSWVRWSPLGGILFMILFAVGIPLVLGTPDNSDTQQWMNYLADSGNRIPQIIGAYAWILGAFSFLWFATGLVNRLRRLAPESDGLLSAASGFSLLFVGLMCIGAITNVAVAGSVLFGGAPVPATDFGIQLSQLGMGTLLLPGMLAAAAAVTIFSILGRRTQYFPAWLSWAGFVVSVFLLFGAAFIPALLFPIWTLVAGIVLLRR